MTIIYKFQIFVLGSDSITVRRWCSSDLNAATKAKEMAQQGLQQKGIGHCGFCIPAHRITKVSFEREDV